MSDNFSDVKKIMEILKNSLKDTEKKVNNDEVEEIKGLVEKYDVVLKDELDELDLILKYETFYDKLKEFVLKKIKEIENIESAINVISGFSPNDNFSSILNNKKYNVNQIIDCDNRIVERIRELETTIYNNRMKELDNMKTERYEDVKHRIKLQVQTQKLIHEGMDIINNSMDLLKKWSNKYTCNVIFDSKDDGDGSNNMLHNKVFKKKNLYFITFDSSNNVYGGYISSKIDKSGNSYICDKNAFIFSLIRDGKVNNKRYFIKQDKGNAFLLRCNDPNDILYWFGNDISVWKVYSEGSWCKGSNNEQWWYDYGNDKKPFTDITYPRRFIVQRIIVLQMK